jgi:hypothetical protein
MTALPAPAATRRPFPASGVGGGLREGVARRHGRRRNRARTTRETTQPSGRPADWVRKVDRSITNSETPHSRRRCRLLTCRLYRGQPRNPC